MSECQQFCVIQLNNLDAVECLLPARIHLHFFLFPSFPVQAALLFIPFVMGETED